MKRLCLISILVLCYLFDKVLTLIQEQNSQYANLFVSQPIYNGYVNSITFEQKDSGYVVNMTQNGGCIQPANALSTKNFTATISLSTSLTAINSTSLTSVTSVSDASDGSILSYLPYLNVYTNNAVALEVYLGLWQVTNTSFTFDGITSSLPSSLEPQADAYIGLGTLSNFIPVYILELLSSTPIGVSFSVYFGENTAELIFGVNMTKASSKKPVAQITSIADPISATSTNIFPFTNWTFAINSLQANQSTFDLTGITAAFDINLNGILMPPTTYNDITSFLCSSYCSSCGTTDDDRNLTTCEISSISLLPSLSIALNNSDDASIPISPENYILSEIINGQTQTVFNFIVDTNSAEWFILGSQVMSTFYTVFDCGKEFQSSCGILIYRASQMKGDSGISNESDTVAQAYAAVKAMENSDSETEDSESSDISDSDGTLFVNLTNVQNLTAAVQQNYQKVLQIQSMVTKVNQASSTSNGFASILGDINQGFTVAEPFLDALGVFAGLGPVTSIVGSFLSVFGIGGGSDISGQLNELSQEIAVVSEQVYDLAQEIATATQDITQMLDVISNDIAQVYTKISYLQEQQTAYFDTILNDEQADVCFAQFSSYASSILGGMQALQALSNITDPSQIAGFKTNFQDTCEFCPFALEGLLNAFNPEQEEGGCDIISILINGNATYYRNWQLSIAATGGYFLSLINMGVTVVSALESLQTNSSDAWLAVQSTNNASYQQAVQRLQSTIVGCYETYYQDAQWNVLNYTQEYPDSATILNITQLLSLLYPWKGWIVMSLSIVTTQTLQQEPIGCVDECSDESFTVDNYFALMNTGQNFSVQLSTGSITVQVFELQNPLGLANNNTQWLWQNEILNCLNLPAVTFGSIVLAPATTPPTGPQIEFCDSLSFITTSATVPNGEVIPDPFMIGNYPGVLSGGQVGTNILDSAGAVYSLSDFSDAEGPDGINAYFGTANNANGAIFYWPNA